MGRNTLRKVVFMGVKIKGRTGTLLFTFTMVGILLIAFNILIFFVYSAHAGVALSLFTIGYCLILIFFHIYAKPIRIHEMISFATEYGQIQRTILREMDTPYALLDMDGRTIWMNIAFERITHLKKSDRRMISAIFPAVKESLLPEDPGEDLSKEVEFEEHAYLLKAHRIPLSDMAGAETMADQEALDNSLIAVYLYDHTALQLALKEVDDESMAAGLIYIDNYDEALESVEDVRRSLLSALIDRKINRYVASYSGIARKLEKDKYFVVMTKQAAKGMIEKHFDLLEDVKTVNIGNEMAVTLSAGIGMDGLSYAQNFEFARNAIDLALGRGGDQAVVKTSASITYYGGKSQQMEKNTRVKARVKAHALEEIITGKDDVIVMGHRIGDVDSFGACVGIYRITKALDHPCHIVLNDVTTSTKPLVELFQDDDHYEKDLILSSQEALDKVSDNTVVVVVAVNKPSITECPELLHKAKTVVVFDHHRSGTEVIENATLSYVEPYASSTCEMVSEILQYIGEHVKIHPEEANAMYAGIMIDTNNFMQKTGVRTFEAAAFLRRNGADMTVIRKLFRENANEYKAKADAVSQAEIYRGAYAISVCSGEGLPSPTILGAQAANELLNIRGVKASFICTEYQNQIFVSARSIDEVNVQVIMEKLGGGGHLNIAGCQMEDVTVTEAIAIIKKTLDTMIEEGDL